MFRRLIVREKSVLLAPGQSVDNRDIVTVVSAQYVTVPGLILHLSANNKLRTSWSSVAKMPLFVKFKKDNHHPDRVCEWEDPQTGIFMYPNGNSDASIAALVEIITRQKALLLSQTITDSLPPAASRPPIPKKM